MKLIKIYAGWACAVALLFALPAFSQTTSGNITGTVYDQTGATVPGAAVTAHNTATGIDSNTVSTSAGDYRFANLPVGTYTVTVNAPGFAKAEIANVSVQLNQTVTTNVKLTVGQASTSVEVTESAVAIDTTTAQIQNTFQTKQITDLPVTASGSGVLNLSLLAPGVATSGAVGAGTGPSVGGQRPRNNNFTVEGIDNNSGSVTGPLVYVPNDSVAEFSMLLNQYSPDFGHSSGGQFNTIVKSGTNTFHGSAYEYFQNRNLNAADNLAAIDLTPLHPRYDNNRFGGTFGGPIQRNKLFFFVNYEYNPVGQAGSAGLVFAPTSAGYSTINSIPGINQTNLSIFQKYVGTAASSCAGQSNCPSVGMSTLAAGPLWNQTNPMLTPIEVGQISVPTPNYQNNEAAVASVDYNLSDRDALRGRFILNRDGFIDTSAQLPVFFTTVPTNNYLVTFSEYHNFSPTVINELRLGFNRNAQVYGVGPQTFPGLDQFPSFNFYDIGGFNLGPDPNAPQFGYQNTYQLTDNVTFTKGAHSFKFGFDGMRMITPQAFTQRSRGDYEYSFLNDYLFDFAPDYIAQRSQGNPIYWGNRWLFGWYGNDSWKVRPNLTVNIGLRYEYHTVPAAENQQVLNAESSVPGLITFGKPKAQTDNFMPRIGIAYSPGTSGRTSFRAGFGINYDVLFDNLGLLSLPPQLSTTQDVTGDLDIRNFLASGGLPASGPSSGLSPADARSLTAGYIPPVHRPKSYQWNFGIQHEFGSNYLFETRYVGTRGTDLDVQAQLNRWPVVTPANALPVFWSMPSQALLNSLPNTLAALTTAYKNGGNTIPTYLNAGFDSIITAYMPWGNSVYHGWANQLSRRFNNGLQFIGSYTWSHAIDDSTADVFSTLTTPRRAQNSQDFRADRSSSALDHRNRFTFELIYDVPFFKNGNWFMKNVLGNWEIAPIYTYQSGTYYTVLSGTDSNLNGDSAPDRAIVNPNGGNPGIGSGTTGLTNSAGDTVAFLVDNPNAKYVATPKGALATVGRNTGQLRPINDIDVSAAKRFNFTERVAMEFSVRAFNVFNHPQYTGGYLNDVAPNGATSGDQKNFLNPSTAIFADPTQAFSSNPRNLILALKVTF